MKKKMIKNSKTAKGLVSLTTIIVVLISVLAGSIYYENNITANVISEIFDSKSKIFIKEVGNINDLSQLNEGWYEIRKGYVFYLEYFDYAVPLYIKVKNPEQQNGLLVVDADGSVIIKKFNNEKVSTSEVETFSGNQITGKVGGFKSVTGYVTLTSETMKEEGQSHGIENIKFDEKTGKVTFTYQGKKYEMQKDEAFDTTKARILPVAKGGTITRTSAAASVKPQIKEHIAFVNEDGEPVYVTENTQTKKITIEINGKSEEYSSELLKPVKWGEWKGDLDKLPVGTGFGKITADSNQNSQLEVEYANKEGYTTRTETTVVYQNNDKKVTTILNPNDPNKKQTTEITTFADKTTTKKISYKVGTENIDKVTYTADGKTLELSGKDYNELTLGSNRDKILLFATKEGFKKPELVENGLKEGTKSIVSIESSGILIFDGERVTKQITNDNKEIVYSGDAKLIDGQTVLGNGASQKIYEKDANGQLRLSHYEIVDSGGLSRTAVTYNQDGSFSVLVSKRDSIGGDWQAPSEFLIKEPINDPESSFYRMYKFEIDGQEYYYDEEATIRGTGIRIYRDENGQKVEVTDFTNEQKENLKASIGIISETKGITTPLQLKSQQFFAEVERIFTEFRGLGYYATLFFDEDSLLVWRDNVDRAFATLYLGTEYWSSGICGSYLDGEDEGIAYAETPQGLAQVGAHIEATRTEPIINEKRKRTFIYKITFNVRNGDYGKDPRAPEEMNINVVLKGEKTVKVFKEDIKIERGDSFGKMGSNAIVQDSPTLFTKVCLTFDDVPLRWRLDNDELCNIIQVPSGEPTKITQAPATTTSSTGSQPPKESEINDF